MPHNDKVKGLLKIIAIKKQTKKNNYSMYISIHSFAVTL